MSTANDNQPLYWPPGSRPQDPSYDGSGLTFETLDHGGDYPDQMPQAIKVTDRHGNTCEYRAVNPRRAVPYW